MGWGQTPQENQQVRVSVKSRSWGNVASLPAFVNTEFGGHAIRLVCFVSSTTASELLHRTCVAVTAIVWLKCYAALYRKSRLTLISSITLWSPYTINCRANPLFLKTNARVNFKAMVQRGSQSVEHELRGWERNLGYTLGEAGSGESPVGLAAAPPPRAPLGPWPSPWALSTGACGLPALGALCFHQNVSLTGRVVSPSLCPEAPSWPDAGPAAGSGVSHQHPTRKTRPFSQHSVLTSSPCPPFTWFFS